MYTIGNRGRYTTFFAKDNTYNALDFTSATDGMHSFLISAAKSTNYYKLLVLMMV